MCSFQNIQSIRGKAKANRQLSGKCSNFPILGGFVLVVPLFFLVLPFSVGNGVAAGQIKYHNKTALTFGWPSSVRYLSAVLNQQLRCDKVVVSRPNSETKADKAHQKYTTT